MEERTVAAEATVQLSQYSVHRGVARGVYGWSSERSPRRLGAPVSRSSDERTDPRIDPASLTGLLAPIAWRRMFSEGRMR